MDCNMPVMDGLQATAELRLLYSESEMFIAALTAYNSDHFQQKCLDVGMNTFLNKPINFDQITSIITTLQLQ